MEAVAHHHIQSDDKEQPQQCQQWVSQPHGDNVPSKKQKMAKAQWACNMALNWRDHLQPKRWHRPLDGQIVICIQVRKSHTDWKMAQAGGWSDCDFAFKWEDHVPPKRWHRPRNGQIVNLHPSEEITYKLRDNTGRGMVRLWFCIQVRRSRTTWKMTQAAG
jgi:hypothetical protein